MFNIHWWACSYVDRGLSFSQIPSLVLSMISDQGMTGTDSSTENSKFFSNKAATVFISFMAKFCPIQFLKNEKYQKGVSIRYVFTSHIKMLYWHNGCNVRAHSFVTFLVG